jgi:hypothetical protein
MVMNMASKKITITVPEDFLEEVQQYVPKGELSAYFTEAARRRHANHQLGEVVDWLEEEHGPLTDADKAEAEDEARRIRARRARQVEAHRAGQKDEAAA